MSIWCLYVVDGKDVNMDIIITNWADMIRICLF